MPTATVTDIRQARARIEAQRLEAYEAWQREYQSTLDALEILDPQEFMRRRAAQLVEEERSKHNPETTEEDPLTDLLGGARLAVAYAESGRDAQAAYQNHENDIRTAYTEALLRGGHVSEITADLNAPGEATIGDVAHWKLFLRAAPKSNPEVCAAEVNEEFLSAALYQKPNLRENYYMAVISPSRSDTKGSTMMVRFLEFQQNPAGEWSRKTTQLYLNNSNTQDANRLLREWGMIEAGDPDRTETDILARPVLLRKENFPEGIMAVGEILDGFASERLGQPVFCGVPMESEVERHRYRELPEVSRRREKEMEPEISKLARDVYDIVAEQNLPFAEEKKAYARLFIASLRKICSDHPEYAEAAFGEEAAKYYYQAHERMLEGDSSGAEAALDQAFENSTSVVICDTVVSEETNQSQESSAQSSADRKEALHCLELKIKGYTIRKDVNCPACTAVTGRKVNAYETVQSIRCMAKVCGYQINKDTGEVMQPSRVHEAENTATEPQESTAQIIPFRPRGLKNGYVYRVGSSSYTYRQEVKVGGAEPIFLTTRGEQITGAAARHLETAITQTAFAAQAA